MSIHSNADKFNSSLLSGFMRKETMYEDAENLEIYCEIERLNPSHVYINFSCFNLVIH